MPVLGNDFIPLRLVLLLPLRPVILPMKHLGIPEGSRFYAGMTGMPMLALVAMPVFVTCVGGVLLFMAGRLGVLVPVARMGGGFLFVP